MSFSVIPFGSIFGDNYGHDWHIRDPVRHDHYKGMQALGHGLSGGDLMKPISPLLSMDIIETESEYKAMADLPGVSAEDLELTVENNSISMKAERKHEHKVDTDKVHRLERSYGSVARRLVLPKNADMSLAQTRFVNGVLTVTVPKHVEMPPSSRKLEVNCT